MIIGHKRVLNFFKKSIENKRLSHAYLFAGPAHLGKKTVAFDFIKTLTGVEVGQTVHSDILIIEPKITEKDGVKKESEISIVQIREVQHRLSLFSGQAPYKIAVIDQADRMTAEASNCLLKTLEEPPGDTILILISSSFRSLLPTIVSRCQLVNFLPVAMKEIENGIRVILEEAKRPIESSGKSTGSYRSFQSLQDDKLKQIIRLASGRPGTAMEYLNKPELLENQSETITDLKELLKADLGARYCYAEKAAKNTIEARKTLQCWMVWFRDLLLSSAGCPDLAFCHDFLRYKELYSLSKLKNIIQAIRKTDKLLANSSINARLALEVLMLEF